MSKRENEEIERLRGEVIRLVGEVAMGQERRHTGERVIESLKANVGLLESKEE